MPPRSNTPEPAEPPSGDRACQLDGRPRDLPSPPAGDDGASALFEEIEKQKAGLGRGSLWVWLPGLLVILVLAIAVFRFTELQHFIELAAAADARWLVLGILAQALTYVCAGGVWWLALRHAGYAMRLREFAFLGIGKLFVDQALPTGGASGTVLVAASLRNRGIPLRIAFFAMLVGLLSYYSAYLASAIATFAIIWTNHRMGFALATAFAVFALVALFVPLAVIAVRSLSQRYIPAWLKRRKTVQIILLEMSEAPLFELMTLRLFFGTVAFQMAVVVLDAATLWISFKAIGYSIDPLVAFAGMVSGSIGATIGPAPLGFGTYEGSAVAILTVLGVPVAPSLTAVVIFRGLSFWLPMLPGMWFSRRELGMRSRISG